MTKELNAAKQQMQRRERYRSLMDYSIYGGIVAFFIAMAVWILAYEANWVLFGGLALYYAGFVGYFAVRWYAPMSLIDEREWEMEYEASAMTLGVMAVIGVITIPGGVVLEETGYLSLPTLFSGFAVGYVLLFVIFGIVYTYLRHTQY